MDYDFPHLLFYPFLLLRAHFCSKRLEYHAIFPEKIVLNNIIPNRDNSRMNYPLGYPDYLFAVVIYIVLENKGSESYKEEGSRGRDQRWGKVREREIPGAKMGNPPRASKKVLLKAP
jgi:hypothetical protein